MNPITCYLDFLSPYAWLAFAQLPDILRGCAREVEYRPVLLGALLRAHDSRGPAEIRSKRDWTYRHVLWLGHQQGLDMQMPARHPFSSLPLLRLALATQRGDGAVTHDVCERLFRHVWRGGLDANDAQRLAALEQELAPVQDPNGPEVKALLRRQTDVAIAQGCFGTPAFLVDGKLFWGLDALPMLRAYLDGDTWFQGPAWEQAPQTPTGLAPQ